MSDALQSLEHALDAVRADGRCEIFQRRTRRISMELERRRIAVRRGIEEGTAVRFVGRDGTLRFGAASGAGVEAARAAWAVASALPGTPLPGGAPPWAGPGRLLDLEGPVELPSLEAMEAWLREAAGAGRASLDAAVAVETLGAGEGLRACRVRGIVWARSLEGGQAASAVARRLDRLDPDDWDEPEPRERVESELYLSRDVALLPAAVGSLIPALVAAVPVGATVGPGWVCEDDPTEAEAPAGGSFDDTGFPAARLLLADGHRVVAAARGPGSRRRLSFREPPVERAANLTFFPSREWSGDGLLVRAARVRAAGRDWRVELDAARSQKGHPVEPWTPRTVVAPPQMWVAACRACVGPLRRTPEGVTSGTLVFEHLPMI